ncbi:LysE family transporter [Leucobacter triazinivorans]|nr:LysE family transporter [Leucobacter triazinivorans]
MICSSRASIQEILSRRPGYRAVLGQAAVEPVRMEFVAALGAGLITGLALAIPLGAIGVLLIQEGASRGWAGGVPAAAAVATVDLLYCVTAVTAGAAIAPGIASWGPWPRIIGGATLVALAIWSLIRARHSSVDAPAGADANRARSGRRYALFFGLTAINPATLIYFAAVVTGLSGVSASALVSVAFIAGVGAASLSWQLLLVLTGAIVRWKAGTQFRRLTTLVGSSIVGVIGILMITGMIL